MEFLACIICRYSQTFLLSVRCCEAVPFPLDDFEHMIMVSFLRMLSIETHRACLHTSNCRLHFEIAFLTY